MLKRIYLEGEEQGVELAIQAMARIPDDEAVVAHLKEHHNLMSTPAKLQVIRRNRGERLLEAREALAQRKERETIADLSDTIGIAIEVAQENLRHTQKMLAEGKISDPSKVARDAADVMAKSVDKSRLLQDKPTTIVVKKTAEEDIKTLVRLGVLEIPDAEVIEDGS